MNTVKAMLVFEYRTYFKSSKFIMPFLTLLFFLYFNYSGLPISIVSSSTISMTAVFLVAVWMGLSYSDSENAVSEQLLMLKLKSERKYYFCKTLFLFLLSLTVSVMVMLFPLMQNFAHKFQAFTRPLTVSDILTAYMLLCLSAFTGIMTGAVFHNRVVRNRNLAVPLAVLFAVMAILKTSIQSDFPVFKVVSWIFPPVADFMHRFSGAEYYNTSAVLSTILTLALYSFVLVVLRSYFLIRNKF